MKLYKVKENNNRLSSLNKMSRGVRCPFMSGKT